MPGAGVCAAVVRPCVPPAGASTPWPCWRRHRCARFRGHGWLASRLDTRLKADSGAIRGDAARPCHAGHRDDASRPCQSPPPPRERHPMRRRRDDVGDGARHVEFPASL